MMLKKLCALNLICLLTASYAMHGGGLGVQADMERRFRGKEVESDSKQREEARRQQRSLAAGSAIATGIRPSMSDVEHKAKKATEQIDALKEDQMACRVMARIGESLMPAAYSSSTYVPRTSLGLSANGAINEGLMATAKIDDTLRESVMLNCPFKIESVVNIWKKYLAGKISDKIFSALSKKLMLIGVAGAGKTTIGKAIAAECDIPYFIYDADSIVGSFDMSKIFSHAVQNKPCVLIVDNMDGIIQRHQNKHCIEDQVVLQSLLFELDQCKEKPILFVGTAKDLKNAPARLTSRFCTDIVQCSLPDQNEREKIIEYYEKFLSEGNSKMFEGIAVKYLAKKTNNFCHRHLEQLMGDAVEIYIERDSSATTEDYDHIIKGIKANIV